jgi:hypothetical protein
MGAEEEEGEEEVKGGQIISYTASSPLYIEEGRGTYGTHHTHLTT